MSEADDKKLKPAVRQVIERYRTDKNYRKLMRSNPAKALSAAGLNLPEGFGVEIHQNKAELMHCVLPFRRIEGQMRETELSDVAGGIPEDVYYGYGDHNSYFMAEYRAWKSNRG